MGSLVGGWSTPSVDPKTARHRRNRSLIKEEIESFWKSKKKSEEEHLRAVDSPSDGCFKEKKIGRKYARSNTFPAADVEKDYAMFETDKNSEKITKTGWWTRSNSAFLNEPPVLTEITSKAYSSQFHVTDMASSSKLVT